MQQFRVTLIFWTPLSSVCSQRTPLQSDTYLLNSIKFSVLPENFTCLSVPLIQHYAILALVYIKTQFSVSRMMCPLDSASGQPISNYPVYRALPLSLRTCGVSSYSHRRRRDLIDDLALPFVFVALLSRQLFLSRSTSSFIDVSKSFHWRLDEPDPYELTDHSYVHCTLELVYLPWLDSSLTCRDLTLTCSCFRLRSTASRIW